MALALKQIRYYGPKDSRNYPLGLQNTDLAGAKVSGTAFTPYLPCKFLKIQGPSGLKFYLNGNTGDNDGIIIGSEGIYQVDCGVYGLRFDLGETGSGNSTKNRSGLINIFNDNNTVKDPYLFIDFLYETDES